MIKETTIDSAKWNGRNAYLFRGSEHAEVYGRQANQYIAQYQEQGQYLKEITTAWEEGWQEAEQEERTYGRVGVLLRTLVEYLDTTQEWYGDDFEKPLYLARKALELVEEEKGKEEGKEDA